MGPDGGLTEKEEQDLWQTQTLLTNLCAVPIVMVTGRMADKVSAKILVPGCIIFQILVMTGYMFIKDPRSWQAYLCAVF